jgi:integrase/recombinase XerD
VPQNSTAVEAAPPSYVSVDRLLESFERHLRAERKDPDTISHYVGATKLFVDFCRAQNLPHITGIRREHVEWWLVQLHKTQRPHSVRNRFIGLRIFFKWLEEEGEIKNNPMARIKPPSVEESPKDVVSPEDMAKVFAHLEKQKRFRDAALIAILYDTGMRASELADCRTEHVNLDTGVIFIPKTKTNRVRVVRLSPRGIRYADRYFRRPRSDPEYVLCGPKGKMTRSGIYWTVRNTFEECGIKGTIGAHDIRHTSASHVVGQMSESEMMTLYGWTDPDMARHYARQSLEKAALEAHTRYSPLERLPRAK